jgi:hypothetical protein
LLDSLTTDELVEWMAYYELEAWGPERDDLRTGLLACAMESMHCETQQLTPQQFVIQPRFDNDPDETDDEALDAKIDHAAERHNRRFERERE